MNDVIFLKETYLTRAQATEYIRSKGYGIGAGYLPYIASKKQGPPYKYLGQTAIYLIADIDAYLASIDEKHSSPNLGKLERGRPPKILIRLPKSA
jgi:hypothetical protein